MRTIFHRPIEAIRKGGRGGGIGVFSSLNRWMVVDQALERAVVPYQQRQREVGRMGRSQC